MVAHLWMVFCLKHAYIFQNSLFKRFPLFSIVIIKFLPCRFSRPVSLFRNLLNKQSGHLDFGRRCRPCWVTLKSTTFIADCFRRSFIHPDIVLFTIFFFFSIWVFFYEHSGLQSKGEGISLTPHYHFHPLHRHLDISRAITAESSPLHIASSRSRTGNLWFPSASR